jgi:chromosome segregation ATPase
VQAIPSLKDKVEKINKEKINCLRQIAKLQEEFDEREDECKQLKATVAELKDASNSLKEIYEFTIRVSFNYVKCNYKL